MRLLTILPAMIGAGLLFAMPAHARNYDCSKPGNANKTVCKNAAAAPAATPAPASAPKTAPAARHYDCSKAGNANKAVCKGAVTTAPATAPTRTAAPASAPFSRPATPNTKAPATTNPAGANGATAMCNDGTYSHSAHRSGTCSHHGGVKTWY